MIPATATNYMIDDLNSGDETDDENCPKKPIPDWARGERLRDQIQNNFNASRSSRKGSRKDNNAFDTEFFPTKITTKREDLDISNIDMSCSMVTQEEVNLCPLGDIFRMKRKKFYDRGSTGIWQVEGGRRRHALQDLKY